MRLRIGERELRPVRGSVEDEPANAELLAHGLDVLDVVAGREEAPSGTERHRTPRRLGREGAAGEGVGPALDTPAAEQSRLAGAPRVEGDECRTREEPGLLAQVEDAGGGLPRPAGDEKHDPAGRPRRPEALQVKCDAAARRARAVEGNRDRGAAHGALALAGPEPRCLGGSREHEGRGESEQEAPHRDDGHLISLLTAADAAPRRARTIPSAISRPPRS